MSNPTPPPPDWLPYAIDRLKDVGLDEAAGWLASHLALVAHAEDDIRDQWDESTRTTHVSAVGHAHWGPILAIVAKARGETPEKTFERLASTWHVPDEAAERPETGHDVRTRLDRAIDLIEWTAAHQIPQWVGGHGRLVEIIAEHRGEDVADTYRRLIGAVPVRRERETPAGNPWAAAIDMAPMIERELDRRRQGVEDFLRENGADPAIHEHVVYPAPGDGMFDCGREPSDHAVRAYRGHIHALVPWADMEGRSTRPTRDEVMSRGSRWPWRLI